jgi:hypothetical protein
MIVQYFFRHLIPAKPALLLKVARLFMLPILPPLHHHSAFDAVYLLITIILFVVPPILSLRWHGFYVVLIDKQSTVVVAKLEVFRELLCGKGSTAFFAKFGWWTWRS